MATSALLKVAAFQLPPNEKLVLVMLAFLASDHDPVVRPSSQWLSAMTGLGPVQAGQALNALVARGVIEKVATGYRIPGGDESPEPIPEDWWPSVEAVDALFDAHPDHDFNMEEAVREFVRYTRERGTRIPASRRDAAFIRNVSALLAQRRPGAATLARPEDGDGPRSVGALLLGLPVDDLRQLRGHRPLSAPQ